MATNSSRSRIASALRARRTRRCSSPSTPTCWARRPTCPARRSTPVRSAPPTREAARIAERENAADKAAGVEQKAQAAGVADILFDLKRRETRAYAHIFSRGVVDELQGAARLNRNPERSAGFVVLKAPDFPSVLVELGYLSNAQDVQAMNSPEWRAKTASAMANAIDRFFAARAKRRGDGAQGAGRPRRVGQGERGGGGEPRKSGTGGARRRRADAMTNAAAGRVAGRKAAPAS